MMASILQWLRSQQTQPGRRFCKSDVQNQIIGTIAGRLVRIPGPFMVIRGLTAHEYAWGNNEVYS
jgi:hypothetical protein